MTENSDNTARIYYTIGEVARMFDVNTSLIRFWEKEFDIIQPRKNKKGNRLFTQKDVDNFHLIYNLVKERGYTLKGAQEKLRKNPEDTQRDYEIIKSLGKIEAFLLQVKKELEHPGNQ
ncbi:MAG: MerR family transcriptional regulator [Bacteroidales bacterium]